MQATHFPAFVWDCVVPTYPHSARLSEAKPWLPPPPHRHTRRQHKEPRKFNPFSVLMGLNPQPCTCVRRLTRKRVSAGAGVLVVRKPSSKLLALDFPKLIYFHATQIWKVSFPVACSGFLERVPNHTNIR